MREEVEERPAVTTQLLEAPDAARHASLTADEAEHRQLERTWSRPPGFYGWLTSTSHKDIGLRFIVTAFINFGLAGLLALAMRTQLAVPRFGFLGPDLYNQFF